MPEVQVGLVALDGQHVVGVGGPQVLPDGPLAAGGVHGDNGSLQDHALKQAGHGCACVALGLARFLGQGQPLPHQEDTGTGTRSGSRKPSAPPAPGRH